MISFLFRNKQVKNYRILREQIDKELEGRKNIQERVYTQLKSYDCEAEKHKLQYDGIVALEDQFTKDYYRENAITKVKNNEKIKAFIIPK